MIKYAVDRSRSTRGSMAFSTGIHALLLLLLIFHASREAGLIDKLSELTEIAYIEAHYGEDVAAKVKLRQLPKRLLAEEPGRGISSDSAIKPKAPTPEPPRPEPRPAMAEIEAPAIEPKTQQQILAEAPQLDGRDFKDMSKVVVDADDLQAALATAAADAPGPRAGAPVDRDAFKPQSGSLQGRQGRMVITDKPIAASSAPRGTTVADIAGSNIGGGGLQSARGQYGVPAASLAPAGKTSQTGGAPGSKGVLDVSGPSGSGGNENRGRKTILDYGSGSGGGGVGSLVGRARIAESVDTEAIVQEEKSTQGKKAVAEASLTGDGISMTISGQIKGRKILQKEIPTYTEKARRKGWEGVVAVHFTVLANGRVKDNVYFEQSSVHRDLNRAAMDAIKKFRFAPLPTEQAAVEQWGVITIVFRLH